MAGTATPGDRSTVAAAASRRRRPADQQPQRPVVRALVRALAQRLRTYGAEPGPAAGFEDHDDAFVRAGRVKDDPVEALPAGRDFDEFVRGHGAHATRPPRR